MPTSLSNAAKIRSLVLVGLLSFVTIHTGHVEGFLPLVSAGLWAVILCSFGLSARLAVTVPTPRLLAMVFAVIVVEHVKETNGVRTSMWTYHGTSGQYLFGVWLWVAASLSVYALSRELLRCWHGWRRLCLPKIANGALLGAVAALIPLTLREYEPRANGVFWAFYAVLLLTSVIASRKTPFVFLATTVALSWMVGITSEYLGSINSGAWTFAHNAHFPPVHLLVGCWPLEIVAQFSIAAFLSGEPLTEIFMPTVGASHE